MSNATIQTATTVRFEGAHPIGDTDTGALPVRHLDPAVAFYTRVLGFAVESRDEKSATLRRDDARIGLAENDVDPAQASVYFAVSDVDALHAEYDAAGIGPTPVRVDDWGGTRYRVFFAREPYGVCFCFGRKADG